MMLSEWIRVFFDAVRDRGVHNYAAVAAARHIATEIQSRGLPLPFYGQIIGVHGGGGGTVCETEHSLLGVADFVAILDFDGILASIEAIVAISESR